MEGELSKFGTVLLFLIGGAVFVIAGLITARLLRPHRPNDEKLSTYECGEDPVGSAWGKFNVRFYVIALIFVLFDVELIFLFPWATVLGQQELIDATDGLWGWVAFFEMFAFVAILALGLAYVWANGMLDWVRPTITQPKVDSPVPKALYDQVNETYQNRKAPPAA